MGCMLDSATDFRALRGRVEEITGGEMLRCLASSKFCFERCTDALVRCRCIVM